MRLVTVYVLLISLCPGIKGQISISHQVFASSGSADNRQSGTMGETIIFGGKNSIMLCQGFQNNANFLLSSLNDDSVADIAWHIYPVPAATGIQIKWGSTKAEKVDLRNTSGMLITFWKINESEETSFLDLSEIPSGNYIISARSSGNYEIKSAGLLVQK
jgi:hypothetical protein